MEGMCLKPRWEERGCLKMSITQQSAVQGGPMQLRSCSVTPATHEASERNKDQLPLCLMAACTRGGWARPLGLAEQTSPGPQACTSTRMLKCLLCAELPLPAAKEY